MKNLIKNFFDFENETEPSAIEVEIQPAKLDKAKSTKV